MYSYEDRLRAVRLYIKLGWRVGPTIRQLGYPTKNSLKSWHQDYAQRHDLAAGYERAPKYSPGAEGACCRALPGHGRCLRLPAPLQDGAGSRTWTPPFAKLSTHGDEVGKIAPVHSDFRCETSSLSLMGSAGRRLDRLHALAVLRLARAMPTTVLPVLPSLRDRLSNRWCVFSFVVGSCVGRLGYAVAAAAA
jgi:hypothetical protein